MKTTRYIPQGFVQFVPNLSDFNLNPTPLFECWVSREQPVAIFYAGKSSKPLFYTRFMTEDSMKKKVVSTISNLMKREDDKIARREARKEAPEVKVGDIFEASWGYDQTNVDFYQVVNIPSPFFVEIRAIGVEVVEGSEGMMSQYVKPIKDKFISDWTIKDGVAKKRVVKSGYNDTKIKITDGITAYKWDGRASYNSWYA